MPQGMAAENIAQERAKPLCITQTLPQHTGLKLLTSHQGSHHWEDIWRNSVASSSPRTLVHSQISLQPSFLPLWGENEVPVITMSNSPNTQGYQHSYFQI